MKMGATVDTVFYYRSLLTSVGTHGVFNVAGVSVARSHHKYVYRVIFLAAECDGPSFCCTVHVYGVARGFYESSALFASAPSPIFDKLDHACYMNNCRDVFCQSGALGTWGVYTMKQASSKHQANALKITRARRVL